MSGLFGQEQNGGGGGGPTGVVFNAGKCEFDGTTVTPVKEKGQVSVGKVRNHFSNILFFFSSLRVRDLFFLTAS